MVLENKDLLYKLLNQFVWSHTLPYYSGKDLLAELESYAWEAFFHACRRWDPAKGYTLSTYAYPAVTNAMRHRMKVLARMGSSMIGYQEKGIVHQRPKLSSLEALDERKNQALNTESVFHNKLSDLMPSATSLDNNNIYISLEEEIINSTSGSELMTKLNTILGFMPEPHATVFRLVHMTKPTHPRRELKKNKGTGLTLSEVGQRYGRSTTWVGQILEEAMEYVRHHMVHLEEEEA